MLNAHLSFSRKQPIVRVLMNRCKKRKLGLNLYAMVYPLDDPEVLLENKLTIKLG